MLGTDFELFMKVGGEHIPVPQTLDIGEKFGKHIQLGVGTMHRDNVMVELCPNPVTKANAMVNNVTVLVQQAECYLTKAMGEEVTLSYEPTVSFSDEALDCKNAQELGCDTDWLASDGVGIERMPINAIMLGNNRCSGGHVHISYGATDELPPPIIIHFSDVVLGTLEATMGSQGVRRDFYGIPGLFRPKTYGAIRGVEYRTPSNQWLSTKKRIIDMATNALSLESVVRLESSSKIVNFLREHWPVLMAQGTLVKENSEECRAFLVSTKTAFPNYDWAMGE